MLILGLKLNKNQKDTYKLASELITQIDDLQRLRETHAGYATAELDSSLSVLVWCVSLSFTIKSV